SQTLTHGPTTPAKTPSTSRSVRTQDFSDRRGNKSTPIQTSRSAKAQQHRGRRRSGGFGGCASGRQTGPRGAVSEEGVRWDGGGRRSRGVGRIEPVSPPTQVQLNFNNLEDFPPVGAAQSPPVATKPSRRINPTPVSAERPNSKPKSCFISTPLSLPASPPAIPESAGAKLTAGSPHSLQEERELLRKERYVWAVIFSLNNIPVSMMMNLICLLSIYVHADVLEKAYLGNVHNCVYFSVRVLENQFELVSHLDKCTLRLLSENERVGTFSSSLKDHLAQAQENCTAKVSIIPFQPATDNRSNFSSDRAFHTFKKQRDVFYGFLREWEDSHKEPGWDFEAALGSRVRMMVSQLTAAGSHSHFARLFQKQLIQMCKGPCVLGSSSDAPDADLLGMLGADSLGRLKRLQQRLVQPQGLIGPCPPPSFPGHQEFFKCFLQTASCCQLNQHLKDGLCQQLLKLDEVSILGPDASPARGEETGDGDMEQQVRRFSSVLLTARLLAKFLGFISFLPYQTSELPSRDIQDTAITLRSKSSPVLDVCAVLRSSVHRRRTILTVPWIVEFLSMLDHIGPLLPFYRTALCLLLQIYKRMLLGRGGELCYMNQLLMVAVLGWLFQIPIFPEDLFFSTDLKEEVKELENITSSQGLDTLPLVDQQLLYTCCPYLGEFRKLLAAFVAGSTSKSGGLIRKITPTSAELRGPSTSRSQQKLQVDLEQAFFHNQPPSLRRTVEFVAERVGSNCVKHIKATLVLELVKGGEKTLRDSLGLEGVNTAKLNDSICAQLCDAGMQALETATRFCSENAPGAVRVLLPLETSPSVLTTAESITTRLATEKACSWLSANITTLLKREWKSAFGRVMKSVPSSVRLSAGSSCVSDCTHKVPLGSEVMIEIKSDHKPCCLMFQEVLSVAVGPRSEEEAYTVHQIESLLYRVGQTLGCRKKTDYLFLIRQLIERGLLGEEEVGTNWPKFKTLRFEAGILTNHFLMAFLVCSCRSL
uniref:Codanin 1 n=1 Tax=Cyprinus carpio TaxID=7962 RepID=A0A8C1G7F6_CYPCA